MNNDNKSKKKNNKIASIFTLGKKIEKDTEYIRNSKEFMKNKKAVSMKHIFDGRDNININIHQSININANPNAQYQKQKSKNNNKNDGNNNKGPKAI